LIKTVTLSLEYIMSPNPPVENIRLQEQKSKISTCEFNSSSKLEHGRSVPVVHSAPKHHVHKSGVKVDSVVHKQSVQSSLHNATDQLCCRSMLLLCKLCFSSNMKQNVVLYYCVSIFTKFLNLG